MRHKVEAQNGCYFRIENRDRFCYARRPRIDALWQRRATLIFAASCQARIRAATQIIAIAASREHDENVSIARPALIKKRGRRDIATVLARGRCGPRRAIRVASTIALHATKRGQASPHCKRLSCQQTATAVQNVIASKIKPLLRDQRPAHAMGILLHFTSWRS